MMTFRLGKFAFTCRPVLGCLVAGFFLSVFGLFIGVFVFSGTLLIDGFRGASTLTDEVNLVINENAGLADVFGTPIELRTMGSEFSSSLDGNVTTASYKAPISGPLNSGTLFAEIKQVGDDVDVTSLTIFLDSGETIQVITKE